MMNIYVVSCRFVVRIDNAHFTLNILYKRLHKIEYEIDMYTYVFEMFNLNLISELHCL